MIKINCKKASAEIENFIRTEAGRFRKKGAVIGISGGIDSSVAATLCARALGAGKVLGVILPEKESANTSAIYADTLAAKLGIKVQERDISSILDAFGVYSIREKIVKKYFPEHRTGDMFRIVMPGNILISKQLNVPSLEIKDKRGKTRRELLSADDYLSMIAATNIKHRVRMTILYHYAEENNYLVAGTTNLTEFLLGFFVKYGDGGVDIDPIRHLYKTQAYKLAKYLNVPNGIINRVPSPDTFSYPVSDEEYYFRLPYETLDLLLAALIKDIPLKKVKSALSVNSEQIKRIFFDLRSKYKIGRYLRGGPSGLRLVSMS